MISSKPYLLAGTMLSTFALWQPVPAQSSETGASMVVAQQTKEDGKERERRGGRPEGQPRSDRPAQQDQKPAQQQRPAAQQDQKPVQQQRPAVQQDQKPAQQQRPAAQQDQKPAQPQRPAAQQGQKPAQPQSPIVGQQPAAGQPQKPATQGQPSREQQRQPQQAQPQQTSPQQSGRPGTRPEAQNEPRERQQDRKDAREQRQQDRQDTREQRQPGQQPTAQPQRPADPQRPAQPQQPTAQPQRPGQPPASIGQPQTPPAGQQPPAAQGRPSSEPQRRDAAEERRDQRDGDRRESARERLDRDGPRRMDAVRQERREERRGDSVVITEPGGRTIIRENNRVIVRHDETRRFSAFGQVRTERRGNDRVSIVARPGGVEIVSVLDDNGRLIRRVRRVGGREYVLINNRPRGRVVTDYYVRLAPPRVRIPREQYIVAAAVAAPALIFQTLRASPVEELERPYTLEEIRYSEPVRARMPRIDLDTVTFDTGAWELTPDQVQRLAGIADAMNKVIEENPQEVFMVEGHTDAVGDEVDNLSLSDRRAETVAVVLTEEFKVPPENLVTQGYGEQHLKVDTQAAERQNRRVTVLRITPLLAQEGTTGSAN